MLEKNSINHSRRKILFYELFFTRLMTKPELMRASKSLAASPYILNCCSEKCLRECVEERERIFLTNFLIILTLLKANQGLEPFFF